MRFVLVAAIVAVSVTATSAAEPTKPSVLSYDSRVSQLPHAYQGPFVRMPDGAILGIELNTVIRSTDEGKTWSAQDVFSADQAAKLNLKISNWSAPANLIHVV